MSQKLTLFVVCIWLAGCTTQVHVQNPPAAVCQHLEYGVTVDAWCGNGCDSYPISHRTGDTPTDTSRVTLAGTQKPRTCPTR